MSSQPLASILASSFRSSLLKLLVLFPFLTVTQADDFTFQPQTPTACNSLTAQWKQTTLSPYSVNLVDKIANQTLFQAIVNTPSIEWPVNATATSLHLAIRTQTHINHNPTAYFTHYISTDFSVLSGTTSCSSPGTSVCFSLS